MALVKKAHMAFTRSAVAQEDRARSMIQQSVRYTALLSADSGGLHAVPHVARRKRWFNLPSPSEGPAHLFRYAQSCRKEDTQIQGSVGAFRHAVARSTTTVFTQCPRAAWQTAPSTAEPFTEMKQQAHVVAAKIEKARRCVLTTDAIHRPSAAASDRRCRLPTG